MKVLPSNISVNSVASSPGIYRVYISQTGEIISTHTDAEDDNTQCSFYPFLHDADLPEGIQTMRRDELEELDRFGSDTDLVAYPPCSKGSAKRVRHPEVKLDSPFEAYRRVLQEWQKRRGSDSTGDAPEAINWPPRPEAPVKHKYDNPDVMFELDARMRRDVLADGGKVINWERPPQQRLLDEGIRVLSTGQIIDC
ncbi:hypothetical protein F4804DRAFT_109733 [Jackrogersella minutella]|nr:hypothetical protein F4804DRAFT_109733 [Jackrogersella minutella]